MSSTTVSPARALELVLVGTLEAIDAGTGRGGVPRGVLYAGLMRHGCSFNQFISLTGALERTGMVTRDEPDSDAACYFLTDAGRARMVSGRKRLEG